MKSRPDMFAEFNKLAAAVMPSPVAARRADGAGDAMKRLTSSAPKPPTIATPNPTQASPVPNPIQKAPPPPVQ
jgi:hypothetical protein